MEIARYTVGQRQRIEAHVEFATALYAARLLELGHRARHVASHRDHDPSVHQHRKYGFQVYAVAFRRVLRADAIDQAERHLGSGLDLELGRLGSRLRADNNPAPTKVTNTSGRIDIQDAPNSLAYMV